jgi:hypothetical protein
MLGGGMASSSERWLSEISAAWYAPPLSAGDDRLVRMVRAVERVLPWAELRFHMPDGATAPVPLPNRDRWLLDAAAGGELPFICNNIEGRAVTMSQREVGPYLNRLPVLLVSAKFPPEPDVWQHAANLVAAVGVALDAWWGNASTVNTGAALSHQIVGDTPDPDRPPPGLPALEVDDEKCDVPDILGWVNYWSKEAAARIGFPDPARHAELLERARQVEGGGWVVQLTDEPLDIDFRPHTWCAGHYKAPEEPRDLSNPAHLRALQRAYELLPAIGGRDKLAQPPP